MAVQSIDYEIYSPRGDDDEDKRTLVVLAKVTMAAGDGIITALDAPGLPARGSSYNHFGEVDEATLQRVSVKRVNKNTPSKTIVTLALEYERTKPGGGPGGGQAPGGGPANDPSEVQAVLTPGYRYLSTPIEKAEFIEYLDVDGNVVPDSPRLGAPLKGGYVGPIVNAAGTVILPTPEHEIAVPTITLERYYRQWDNIWDGALLATNSDTYEIRFYDGAGVLIYARDFEPGQLLLQSINATQKQFGNEIWYWLRFEMWIGEWERKFRNEGLLERKYDGSATAGLYWVLNDLGERQDQPVPLDVDGTHKKTGTPLYTRWKTRNEFPFSMLGLLF